ncbi:MAG: sugar ABC transporter permease [Chloroflexi bacterium]|nr:sugar ABC transporter permease [Anaerolineaceae bacterium]NMB90129.1 sugar ABC transporter permease [Chloroflexota bacterium]
MVVSRANRLLAALKATLLQGYGAIRSNLRKNYKEYLAFLAFFAPNLVIFAVFTYWPIIYSGYLSLTNWNYLTPSPTWVGLDNYVELFQDEYFWTVLKNTLIYSVSVVVIAQTLAFLLALLLNKKLRGQGFFRTIAFTPHITTTAAAALVFVLLLDPKLGPLSLVYNSLGMQGISWLSSNKLALWAVIIVGIWKEIGFSSVFFLAGLQSINPEYYEAAEISGASGMDILRYITIPLMTPVIFFLMVSGLIQAMKAFDVVAIMTAGGPVYPASATYVYHLYQLAFRNFRAGYASAFALIFFVVIIVITIIQLRSSEKWVNYGD